MNPAQIVRECRAQNEAASNLYRSAGHDAELTGHLEWSLVFADLAVLHESLSSELAEIAERNGASTAPSPEAVRIASTAWDTGDSALMNGDMLALLIEGETRLVIWYRTLCMGPAPFDLHVALHHQHDALANARSELERLRERVASAEPMG
jgi:hypothetical protein